jgi:hypothetical protein
MYIGGFDEEPGTQNALHYGLSIFHTIAHPLREATIMLTRGHNRQLSLRAPLTRTLTDNQLAHRLQAPEATLRWDPDQDAGILNAICDTFTLRITRPDKTRWWCYERGEQTMVLSSPGVDGPPCVQIDADLGRDLLTTGISCRGLQRFAWREAIFTPGLRFILRDTPSGDEVSICAPDGPASYLRTLATAPVLSITRITGEAHIQLAIARVPEERSHIELWAAHHHYITRSGPLLAAVKAAVAGSTHRSRAQRAIKPLPGIAILLAWHERAETQGHWNGQQRERLLNTGSIAPLLDSLKVALPQWRLHR